MEGDQLPAGDICQLLLAIGLQFIKFSGKQLQIPVEGVRMGWELLRKTCANVLRHLLCAFGGQPEVRVVFVFVAMVIVLMVMAAIQKGYALAAVEALLTFQHIGHKVLKTAAGKDHEPGTFHRLDLADAEGIVMQAGDAFRHQLRDRQSCAFAQGGGEAIYWCGGGGDVCGRQGSAARESKG